MKPYFLLAFCLSVKALAGAWGPGPLDNDDALDWLAACARSPGSEFVGDALTHVVNARYVEAPEASAALAAAEVVAAAAGHPMHSAPPDLMACARTLDKGKAFQQLPLAKQAVERIKVPTASELNELWSESPESASAWRAALLELEARLGE